MSNIIQEGIYGDEKKKKKIQNPLLCKNFQLDYCKNKEIPQ
jgi:hypothetical protein